jgi:hypothetical protein
VSEAASLGGGPAPLPAAAAGLAKPPPRRLRATLAIVLALLGLAGVAGGGFALYHELTRAATPAEIAAAGAAEAVSHWSYLPAGQVFPATVSYVTSDGIRTTAHRVGIAPAASCAAAFDASVATVLHQYRCRTALRATYLDASGTMAVTVAIAVMPASTAAGQAAAALSTGAHAGALVPAFPGTAASQFGTSQRAWFQMLDQESYLVFATAGYADGRPGASTSSGGPAGLGQPVAQRLMAALTTEMPPCRRKNIRC